MGIGELAEDEEEEEASGDEGEAAMRAGVGHALHVPAGWEAWAFGAFRAVAVSAAATAGRMEAISPRCGLGAGG